jgi:hypothetical protein
VRVQQQQQQETIQKLLFVIQARFNPVCPANYSIRASANEL